MRIKSFFKLVELQTKVACVIPFLIGTFYAYFRFNEFSLINILILFMSMMIFDMASTGINNYVDYKKAIKKDGYGYEIHNAIVRDKLNPKLVRNLLILMVVISSLLGLILVKRTNIIVLVIGIIAFIIGITYSYGPTPISRTPFGEIFSAIGEGFLITFLSVYIHVVDKEILNISVSSLNNIGLSINLIEIINIVILAIPSMVGIANIMLANNICDLEEDIENKRYTLPYFIGREKALKLFKALYYISFISIIFAVVVKILPIYSLVVLILINFVNKNVSEFNKLQTKKDTFVLAVKNFAIPNLIYAITILIGIVIK